MSRESKSSVENSVKKNKKTEVSYHIHVHGYKCVLIDYMESDKAFMNYCRSWMKQWIEDGNDKKNEYTDEKINETLQGSIQDICDHIMSVMQQNWGVDEPYWISVMRGTRVIASRDNEFVARYNVNGEREGYGYINV